MDPALITHGLYDFHFLLVPRCLSLVFGNLERRVAKVIHRAGICIARNLTTNESSLDGFLQQQMCLLKLLSISGALYESLLTAISARSIETFRNRRNVTDNRL